MKPSRANNKPMLGEMKHRVTLQAKASTSDAMGGQVDTYTDVATVWCKIENLNISSMALNYATRGVVTHRLTTRYQPSWHAYWDFLDGDEAITANGQRLSPKMRFKYHQRFFRILGVLDVNEEHEFYEFGVEEIQ